MTVGRVLELLVKFQSGAYFTQTVDGCRASSTVSAEQAVQRLGRKLHGAEVECTPVRDLGAGVQMWRLPAPRAHGAQR